MQGSASIFHSSNFEWNILENGKKTLESENYIYIYSTNKNKNERWFDFEKIYSDLNWYYFRCEKNLQPQSVSSSNGYRLNLKILTDYVFIRMYERILC